MTRSLVLRLGDRLLALPLGSVVEVFRMVAMAARLPRAPRHCFGVVDYHGRLLPVFDLAARLGLCAPRNVEDLVDGHVVLVQVAGSDAGLGLAVDEVRELSESPVESIGAGEGAGVGPLGRHAVRCADGRLALLLDPAALLTVRARHQVATALAALAPGEAR